MARRGEWRRSWNREADLSPGSKHLDLITVQPGETLTALWWQYQLTSGQFNATKYEPGLSTTIAALQLRYDAESPTNPLRLWEYNEWLWWEMADWDTQLTAATTFTWFHRAPVDGQWRKIKAQRKGHEQGESTLYFSLGVDLAGSTSHPATTAWAATIQARVAVSAYVLLP